jgi:N-acetylglucosamine transport system permease protein
MSVDVAQPLAEAPPALRPEVAGTRPTFGASTFSAIAQLLLVLWAILVIFPFVWMTVTALKSDPEILSSPWSLPAT